MRTTLPGMICAGRDADGATLVVGRATHNGDVLPAKAKPEHGVAYVAYGSYEHEKRSFEVSNNIFFLIRQFITFNNSWPLNW